MSEFDLHSFILACDFRVDDLDRMWKWLNKHRESLASIGAHHVVLYTSIWEPGRVMVTIGIRQAGSAREVLRSPGIFELFDISVWMSAAGFGAYPTQFVGRFAHLMSIGERV